jgi:hypothetical protein
VYLTKSNLFSTFLGIEILFATSTSCYKKKEFTPVHACSIAYNQH